MFQLENDLSIGNYLRSLIDKNKEYKNPRQFCVAYVKLRDGSSNDEEVRKLYNRFSQILNGEKRLQISDLPYVTELLGVSCEEILSAGQNVVPRSGRVTNYSVAFSTDPEEWQKYIDRGDRLILNFDEYGKSVLDYAYQFRNYPFLKYLIDKGYIVFKDSSDSGFHYGYGAETTIKRRDITNTDILGAHLLYNDELRMNVITLAIENKDYSVLDSMKARETPMMHFAAIYSSNPENPEFYDCSRLVDGIVNAPDEVLEYFSKEYSIKTEGKFVKPFFIFQHLDDVIEKMVKKHDKRVISVIKSAALHNRNVYGRIRSIENEAVQNTMNQLKCSKEEAANMIMPFTYFFENCGALRFFCHNSKAGIASNIIRCNVKSSDQDILFALEDLNSAYGLVKSIVDRRN